MKRSSGDDRKRTEIEALFIEAMDVGDIDILKMIGTITPRERAEKIVARNHQLGGDYPTLSDQIEREIVAALADFLLILTAPENANE